VKASLKSVLEDLENEKEYLGPPAEPISDENPYPFTYDGSLLVILSLCRQSSVTHLTTQFGLLPFQPADNDMSSGRLSVGSLQVLGEEKSNRKEERENGLGNITTPGLPIMYLMHRH
jgi:hypothetical protein